MWVLTNTRQCSPLLAVLVFAEKGKKCAQKIDARKMLACPHNVCNAYEMLAWCDRCMVYPVIYMNKSGYLLMNLRRCCESVCCKHHHHYTHIMSILQASCADVASTLQAPLQLYAHYEHPASIMCRCCEYAASTITLIRMLNIFDKLMFIILIYETLQIEKYIY